MGVIDTSKWTAGQGPPPNGLPNQLGQPGFMQPNQPGNGGAKMGLNSNSGSNTPSNPNGSDWQLSNFNRVYFIYFATFFLFICV